MLIVLVLAALAAAPSISAAVLERIPLDPAAFFFFETNVGQADPAVKFLVRGVPTPIHLTADSISLTSGYANATVAVRFAPSGTAPNIRPLDPWPGVLNRFEGDSQHWFRTVPAYRRVQYSDIHPGVDLIVRESGGQPAFTFVIRPSGDVNSLFLEASSTNGAVSAGLSPQGEWYVSESVGNWLFTKPKAWQESDGAQIPVEARFVPASTSGVSSAQVRFQVSNFDRTRPLYINVDRSLPRYRGGRLYYDQDLLIPGAAGSYAPGTFAVDGSGNIYLSGATSAVRECGQNTGSLYYCPDAFVAALRPTGEPIFLTILAGRFDNSAARLALDSDSNVVVVGNTGSPDFPVTPDALQQSNAGPLGQRRIRYPPPVGDLFLARLDPRTGDLLYSTFYGGPGEGEVPQSLAIGSDGSMTVLTAAGKSFPTTAGAWLPSSDCNPCNGVVRFDRALKRPLFSTLVPGSAETNFGIAMALDPDLNVYIAGSARLRPFDCGENDGYLLRLAPDGSRPLFATCLSDFGFAVPVSVLSLAADSQGDVWLNAETLGLNGPASYTSGLMHIAGDGLRLLSVEFFPGRWVGSSQLLVDSAGRLFLAESLYPSPILETTPDALLRAPCSSQFLEQRDAEGSLRFATYLPGGAGLAAGPAGVSYRLYSDRIERLDLSAPAVMSLACVTGAASRANTLTVTPGQVVTLVGSLLGPDVGVAADPGAAGRYPRSLVGVRVLVGGTPAPLLYVQASQINAVVPYSTPYPIAPGTAVDVAVEYQERTSAVGVGSAAIGFALFTADASGSGPAAALNENGTPNSLSNPARRGSIVVLYGTGAGLTSPPSEDGVLTPIASPDALPKVGGIRVLVGEAVGEIVYAGAAPGLVSGVTQINVRIPESISAGVVDIRFSIAGVDQHNFTTIAVQ